MASYLTTVKQLAPFQQRTYAKMVFLTTNAEIYYLRTP